MAARFMLTCSGPFWCVLVASAQPVTYVFIRRIEPMTKITEIALYEAFNRAVWGESVNSIAKSMGVWEGALRHRFKRDGQPPAEVRRMAFELFHLEQQVKRLSDAERRAVDRLVAERLAKAKAG